MMNLLVPINEQLVELSIDHTVVTPNDRLAKEFTNSYDQHQFSTGKSAWESPDVKSFSNHLKTQFLDHTDLERQTLRLLDRRDLFARLFAIVPSNQHSLINQAIDAIDLIHKYEVEIAQFQSLSLKCGKLIEWYKSAIADEKTTFFLESQLPSFLSEQSTVPKKPLLLYQFDHLAPAEKKYLNYYQSKQSIVLCNSSEIKRQLTNVDEITIRPAPIKSSQTVVKCNNFTEEIVQASKWAVAVKTGDKDATIGIVVPKLTSRYIQVTRQIAVGLDPHKGSHTEQFNISSGQPLSNHPIWSHALLFLRAATDELTPGELDILLNSKFFHIEELISILRQWQSDSAKNLWPRNPTKPNKQYDLLYDFHKSGKGPYSEKTMAEWVPDITKMLGLVGWPSLDQLQTFEYQAYQAINRELTFLNTLDPGRKLEFQSALELIEAIFANTLHAPERQAQDIQVLGLIESLGLTFTHVWVCGMDEDNFPPRSNHNPFMPLNVKKQYGMPKADQAGELHFSKTLIANWTDNSRQVTYSYSSQQNDTVISKSPLIDQIAESTSSLKISDFHSWFDATNQPLVDTSDISGPQFSGHSMASGLTMLKDQINCPFKSFATNRLDLAQKQTSTNFPQAFEKGILIHEVLAKLLSKSRTQKDVIQISENQIHDVTAEIAKRLLKRAPEIFRSREAVRVSNIVKKWIDLEAKREPFQIIGLEIPFTIQLAGIEFSIRADRIDKLAEGLILIDYKTGRVNLSKARSENLKEPQLATYALAIDELRGAFYAQLNDEEQIRVTGISADIKFGDKIAT